MAKKKRKRRSSPPGVDVNEARRQRLEARRAAKAEAEAKKRRAERRRQLVIRSLSILVLTGLVWFLFFRPSRPDVVAGHPLEQYQESITGPTHVEGTVDYEMNPPVSGQHSPTTVPCGTHAEQPPAEMFVHTLEHGAIGLLYDPEAARPRDIAALEEIAAESESHVLSAPWQPMRTTFAITSWGEMMRLDELDLPAVNEYIDTFREKGPEKRPCDNQVSQTFEPEPTPTPEERGNNGG